jgi:Ca2+-binding RTX toxin-like protein
LGFVTTAAGTSYVLAIEDQAGNTDTIIQIGGVALPPLNSLADFQALESSITAAGQIPSGPFAPGQVISVASFPGVTTREMDFFDGSPGNDLFNGGAGDDDLFGYEGNDTLNGGADNDTLQGGSGNDSLNPGDNAGGADGFDLIEQSSGNDAINFSDIVTGYVGLSYSNLSQITVTIDGATNTGSVDKGGAGTDTLLNVNNPLASGWTSGGLGLLGTNGNDTFNLNTNGEQWMSVRGGAGNDTYNLSMTLPDVDQTSVTGIVRLDFLGGSGLNANLATGVVSNDGRGGVDTINGFARELRATDGNDSVVGSAGDESFIMRAGNDTVDGGGGFDRLRYDRSGVDGPINADWTTGQVTGQWGGQAFQHNFSNIEQIRGSRFNDVMVGDGGNQSLLGEEGNDTLTGGAGNDTASGGAGTDTFVFNVAVDSATITLVTGAMIVTSADGTDRILNDIENFSFTDADLNYAQMTARAVVGTPVTGTTNAENVDGTASPEEINAGGGSDWITPGGGSDTIDGGDGRDMLSFFNLTDTPGRTNTDYRLETDMDAGTARSHDDSEQTQFSSIERLTGTIYADRIRGTDGDDEIRSLGDYDWIIATTGRDTIDGGTGQDMISFVEYQSTATNVIGDVFSSNGLPPTGAQASGLVVDLANPGNNTGLAAGLTMTSVERVTGSGRQDVFYGDTGENDFRGLGDYDWFVSSTGGRERYFGGDGVDTVTYFNASAGVIASLRNGARVDGRETGYGSGGDAARDLYFEIENLVGSRHNDSLTGSNERNQLNGLEGDDFIFGYGGVDYLMGGAGNDTINGGDGSDFALFSGNSGDYTLTRGTGANNNQVTVVGADGTDSLTDVEYFRFDDTDVTIWSL